MKRPLITGACVLVSSLLAISVWSWFRAPSSDEPSFRGRSATYWAKAIKAASCSDGAAIVTSSQQSWATRLRISVGLRHKDDDVRDVLFGDDPDKIPVLIRLLQHQDPHIRRFAARGFQWPLSGAHVSGAEAAIPALIVALKDDYAYVRESAVRALDHFGPAASEAVPALVQALEDEDERVRREAIHALGEIGPEAREAVPALIKLLKSEDHTLRGDAAYALEGSGRKPRLLCPTFLRSSRMKA